MFSFHKPKIYRSLKGCCICRAKSSSSRFTDSKRYEMDFEKCFQLYEKRSGEICNACVLLVKRWKKLPLGSTRNWQHVVDARAGPGTKSMMKMKSRNKEENKFKKKHKHRSKHRLTPAKPPCSPGGLSDDILSMYMADEVLSDNSDNGSGSLSPLPSDCSDDEGASRRKQEKSRRRKATPVRFSSFLDLTYWKKTQICCGIVFKGANGEVLVDTNLLRRCKMCKPSSAASSKAQSETSSAPATPEMEEPGPLPLTAPATPQDLMDSCTFPEPPILDRAMPLDLHHSSIMEQEAMSEQHQIANAVLDLSLPTSLKRATDLVPQNRCIAMEV